MRPFPLWFRIVFAVLPFVSLVIFPWSLTLSLMFAAGLVYSPLALVAGILADVLYHPGTGLWEATVWGIGLMVLTYAVRYFVRRRVM